MVASRVAMVLGSDCFFLYCSLSIFSSWGLGSGGGVLDWSCEDGRGRLTQAHLDIFFPYAMSVRVSGVGKSWSEEDGERKDVGLYFDHRVAVVGWRERGRLKSQFASQSNRT